MKAKYNKIYALLFACMFLSACDQTIQLGPDAILPNGAQYSGDIEQGLFHGDGTLKYPSGAYYQGKFENGVFHGKGTYVLVDGSRYHGDFHLGEITGEFEFTDSKAVSTYKGEMKNGLAHGFGTSNNESYSYTGNFNLGNFEGEGKLSYVDGDVYYGQFLNGEYHGEGDHVDVEGNRYQGQFKEGLYHGKGSYAYEFGGAYVGEFSEGEYHGEGRYTYQDSWYEGAFIEGEMVSGSFQDSDGNQYKGDVNSWQAHGNGEMHYQNGSRAKGEFSYGSLTGEGELHLADESHYIGGFEYNQYQGEGVLTLADGSTYEGEFSYGQYSGEGVLTEIDANSKEPIISKGTWRRGKLAFNSETGEREHQQADIALEYHQVLLNEALAKLEPSDDNTNMYFLGVAGDGRQSVFRREVQFVQKQIEQKYATQGRSLALINDHKTAQDYPLATSRSIAQSIKAIGEKMNREDDILFLYLTSHGSDTFDFSLGHDSIRLSDFGPKELLSMLDSANIKWRVLVVSACYSGGFVDVLSNSNTLILTAADSENTSFGCSDDADLTYFAKALFKEVLSNEPSIDLPDAFEKATEIINKWESEQELTSSNPMISAPSDILNKLKRLNKQN